jgi:hypothetical protein
LSSAQQFFPSRPPHSWNRYSSICVTQIHLPVRLPFLFVVLHLAYVAFHYTFLSYRSRRLISSRATCRINTRHLEQTLSNCAARCNTVAHVNFHLASNKGWHSRLVGGYCLVLALSIRAANSRQPPLSLGCIATGGGRVLDWSPIFLGLNCWRASINRHSMGSFRATLSIYKESNNAPIFFKTDGERFAQPKTVKLLADCKYRLDIVFRPAKKMA